jgi:hypothetical protein
LTSKGEDAVNPEADLPFDNPNAWNRPLIDVGAEQPITFGDTVRVRTTVETEAAGLAGLVGRVVRETMPSKSGQEVAPRPKIDCDIGVDFEELGRTLFLPHDVLEFIDYGLGLQKSFMTSRGDVTWVPLVMVNEHGANLRNLSNGPDKVDTDPI